MQIENSQKIQNIRLIQSYQKEEIHKKNYSINQIQQMHIQPKEYLALLDEIEFLKKDNILLRQQNAVLISQLAQEKEKRIEQEQGAIKNMKVVEELHAQAIAYEHQQKQQIVERIAEMEKQTKEYLENKFISLENSSLTQVKSLELQNAKKKLQSFQLMDFVNKIKVMHDSTMGIEHGKGKKETTLSDMVKWLKSMPGISINLNKTMSSMSTTTLKKQSSSKGLKQNRSVMNSSQSRLRVKY